MSFLLHAIIFEYLLMLYLLHYLCFSRYFLSLCFLYQVFNKAPVETSKRKEIKVSQKIPDFQFCCILLYHKEVILRTIT